MAFNLCIETSEAHYLLKPGHDPELASAGPGTVLTSELVSRAFSMGLDRYEFLGADDRYKLRWTKQCHDLVRVQAFARSVPGAADRLVQTRGRAVAKAVLRR